MIAIYIRIDLYKSILKYNAGRGVGLTLLVISMIAGLLPTRRAATLDPVRAIRTGVMAAAHNLLRICRSCPREQGRT
jgi:hypothetical protein